MNTKNSELLKYCRVYRCESVNPYEVSLKYWVWEFEKKWVEEAVKAAKEEAYTPYMSEALDRYRLAGLIDFGKGSGIPLSLRAVLYSLFLKGNELPINTEFERFFERWKKGELD